MLAFCRRRAFSQVFALSVRDLSVRMESTLGPVAQKIESKIQTGAEPHHLEIINESYMHNVPKGSETHFKVVVVSSKFEGMPLIKRHKLIYGLLEEEMASGVHALAIEAKTPSQWENSDQVVKSSPACRGGFGK
ncbi:DNA-binding transcriptional regulator BolA [Neocloeon triangulifer]|uniref:DNA-binding transcriptional regulator BolA n=1 Tax=Neocloeon triangulifer TaxID=2078957 RepID=UPI00286FAE63|nr:DNA-binding transcriptional regulator BolA [Neocloeon triangulifer]XP_059488414.1 DNA-binding transcriptional regulator BolA [Neocloeon triangulifer]XP_059488415.1 DNA-binding transcriptional regulator BolA [Neocloeon triangulifer]